MFVFSSHRPVFAWIAAGFAFLSANVCAEEVIPERMGWRSPISQVYAGTWDQPGEVNAVVTDYTGVVWFGGSNGLYRYTGTTLNHVCPPELKDESGNPIPFLDLEMDEEGKTMYFLSKVGIGEYRIDEAKTSLIRFEESLEGAKIKEFVRDGDGTSWILTSEGLFSHRRDEGFLKIGQPPSTYLLNALILDRTDSGVLWMTSLRNGLVRYEVESDRWEMIDFSPQIEPPKDPIFCSLCQTDDGKIWLGGRNTLINYSPESETFEEIRIQHRESLYWRRITSLYADPDKKTLWIGTVSGKGLLSLNTETGQFSSYDDEIRFQSTRLGVEISDLTVGKSGTLWIATKGDGLLRTPRHAPRLDIIRNELHATALFVNGIGSVTEKEDTVYVTTGDRVITIDTARREGGHFPITELVVEGRPLELIALPDIGVLGFFHNRIARLIANSDGSAQWEDFTSYPNGRVVDNARAAEMPDSKGRIWFSAENNAYTLDTSTRVIEHQLDIPQWGTRTELYGNEVWLSTKEHLIRINTDSNKTEIIPFKKGTGIENFVWDGESTIWLGTNHGLTRYCMESGEYKNVTSVRSPVNSVVLGKNDDLWLSTENRLKRFDLTTGAPKRYPAQSNIESIFGEGHSVYRLGSGKLMLRAYNYLVFADEPALLENQSKGAANLIVSDVAVQVRKGASAYQNQNAKSFPSTEISLPPSAYNTRITLSLLDYRFPEDNQYLFQINDQPWKAAPGGIIETGDLNPGKHTIRAKAINSAGEAGANILTIPIRMQPYFWEATWFYLAAIAFLFALGFAANSFRTRLLRKSKEELEQTHSALQKSETRFRRIFEESSDALLVTDRELVILTANPAAIELLGCGCPSSSGEVDFRHYDANYDQLEQLVADARSGSKVRDVPFRLVSRCGMQVQTLLSISGVHQGGGNLQFQLRDVTQQAELESRIQQTQRMEAVGTLAGGIAHDFNNLLSPILIRSQLAEEGLQENGEKAIPEAVATLRTCQDAANYGADLVKKLLHFARKVDEGEETIDLVDTTQNAIRFLRRSVPSHIEVSLETDESAAWLHCSSQQLEQAIMNLGANAAHAIGIEAGSIQFRISGDEESGHWVLEVTDTGCGMDWETSRRVFEPFFTTKEVGEGSGLGLTMVHTFIKDSEGKIELVSEEGTGTTFTIRLPKAEAPEIAASGRDITAQAAASRLQERQAENILVVDDDAMVLKATSMILEKRGHTTASFTDPAEALDCFRTDPSAFDAVVTDQMMPGITGLVLAERIRELRPAIPILLLTGFADILLESGASHVIVDEVHVKPLDYPALDESLQRLIAVSREEASEDVSLPG
ncbi:MAG: ATP-binding protein [Verrucomicrobiota bacterium]